jgi:very-short-patch-repair endonuclease
MVSKSLFDMYYGATEEIQERAKCLRKSETSVEKMLWRRLKNKRFKGYKFRRQHPISQFIADFYCHELKLVIEVDGEIHRKKDQNEYDENRMAEMERFSISTIRFTNKEIEQDIVRVLDTLSKFIGSLSDER